jgi:hypothetical protein
MVLLCPVFIFGLTSYCGFLKFWSAKLMKRTQYLTAVVTSPNRLEIEVPELSIGQTVELIVITDDLATSQSPSQIDRRAFLRLPLAERRRILESQAELALPEYEQDTQWQEWLELDMGNSYE